MDASEPAGGTDFEGMLRALGVSAELIDRAIARGDPIAAVFEDVLWPEMEERVVTPAEVEADGGLTVEQSAQMMASFGLGVPEPEEPAFTRAEAEALIELGRLSGVYGPELMTQMARVYGRQLARIAQAEIQVFRAVVEPELRAAHDDTGAAIGEIHSTFARLVPLADPLLVGVHRRWVEHQVAQAIIREAESGVDGPLPGAIEVAFLFCDLKDFTRYVDREGDEAGVVAIDRFAHVVVRERGDGFRFTKMLGDGMMLVYGDPAEAVGAGARIIAAMPSEGMPPVHASVHHGVAIAREGDYFGGAVNLAARVLGIAEAGELLATRSVHTLCRDRFEWERAGAVRVRGIAGLVELFRLSS